MLAIRLQRTGRTGHAQFRLIAQDSRFSPTSGRVVAYLGSYDPHSKQAQVDKEKVAELLAKGAQPSDRAAKLLKSEGVKLPVWFMPAIAKKREVRNPDKFSKEATPVVAEGTEATEVSAETPATEADVADEPTADEAVEEKTESEVKLAEAESEVVSKPAAEQEVKEEEPEAQVEEPSSEEDKLAEVQSSTGAQIETSAVSEVETESEPKKS